MTTLVASDPVVDRLIVFSDLDGTLLDHASYDHAPARPTLDRLARHGIPLILASSKTAPEMRTLASALGLQGWPMICENGAGIVGDTHDTARYAALRAILDDVPRDLRAFFEGFGDMGPARIAQITGLDPDAAAQAAARSFSEPGLWTGPAAAREAFLDVLEQAGVTAQQGGRFLTLSFGANKAGQMAAIQRELNRDIAIALGDAPNDAALLSGADHAIGIPNAGGANLPDIDGLIVAPLPGPAGWNAALDAVLTRLGVPA